MPIGEPFLFLDTACFEGDVLRGTWVLRPESFFFKGHFKGRPVAPASLMLEALGQLGVLFLVSGFHEKLERPARADKIGFISADGVRCSRFCVPGETLELSLKVKKLSPPLAVFGGRVECGGQRACYAEEIRLMFDNSPLSVSG